LKMLKLEPMSKVRIIAAKAQTERLVGALYSFGGVEGRQTASERQERPAEEFGEISRELVRLRALAERLAVKGGKIRKATLAEALEEARQIPAQEFENLFAQAAKARQEAERAGSRASELEPFKGLNVKQETLRNGLLSFHYAKPRKTAKDVEAAFAKARVPFQAQQAGEYFLYAFPKAREAQAKPILEAQTTGALGIPQANASFKSELAEARALQASALRDLEQAGEKIAALKRKHAARLADSIKALELHSRKAQLPSRFAASDFAVTVEGWVPSKNFGKLEKAVAEATAGKTVVEKVATKEHPPSVLDNPKAIRPFEFLVRFFSLPSEHELDPTIFISMTFPVFFGMILGDVGYGLCAVLLALFLRSKFKKGFYRDVSGMMLLSGLSTTAFGFVYTEFFGFNNIFGYHWTPLIHRLEAEGLAELMALVIFIGMLHLALGFIIGAVTAYREKEWKHAVAKTSWLFAEIGLIAFLASSAGITFFELIVQFTAFAPGWFWGALGVIGMAGIAATEGAVALMELPGLFSNLFSYLRIMALGVSAVILALIIDKIPLQPSLEPMGLLSFILFAAFFVLAHIGALMLGLFESSIQSLRLHYVEFFSKFYRGGGIAFNPLSREMEGEV